jgi:hypothetical protein
VIHLTLAVKQVLKLTQVAKNYDFLLLWAFIWFKNIEKTAVANDKWFFAT